MSEMAPGGMEPGGWQAVPSPRRDVVTQGGCPHSPKAHPSSARRHLVDARVGTNSIHLHY